MHLIFKLLFATLLLATQARGDVRLPAIFSQHMVLQQNTKVPIWGWADPNEAVTIAIGEVKATSITGADGRWTAVLENLKASDRPVDLIVAGKNTITVHDVLVGDVWVCSGQSNMEFGLRGAHNAGEEIPKANHPTLRLFMVGKKAANEPQDDCVGQWVVCTPVTAAKFSAVGYFFARDIQKSQHVPVGMIGTYTGGMPAQSWTSMEALKAEPSFGEFVKTAENMKARFPAMKSQYESEIFPQWQRDHDAWERENGASYTQALKKWATEAANARAAGQPEPKKPVPTTPEPRKPVVPELRMDTPTVLSNGMLAPIIPFAIKGAIWYQGEANGGRPKEYEKLFPTMITDWRARWRQGDFPFIWVQLPNFQPRDPEPTQTSDYWPGLREAQSRTLKLPNTGQAVTLDIGESHNLHPRNKLDVGRRLALTARHVAYGEDLVYSGPTYDSLTIEGDKARVKFKNIGSGLTIDAAPATQPSVPEARPDSHLKGFSIAGADNKFCWATAVIEADGVIVSSPDVRAPVAVRYGWANNPEVNLYNKEGLPAAPFRTDR